MSKTLKLIARNGDRELYIAEMVNPSGELERWWEGREYFDIGGGQKRHSPARPTFKTEAEMRAWLAGAEARGS